MATVLAIGVVTLVVSYLFVRFSETSFGGRAERRSSEEAVHFAELFYKAVWTPSLQEASTGAIHDINLSLVDAFAHDIVFGLSIVRVSIFDLDGMPIYSTDPYVTNLGGLAKPTLYQRVVSQGNPYSVLERSQSLTLPTGEAISLDVINTVTPLLDASSEASHEGKVVGILQLYQDVTRDLSAAKAQAVRTAIFGSIGTGVALFLFLFLIVLRADRALRRQELELEHAHVQNMEAAKLSAMGLLVSGVAHELNNPLTAVSGLSKLLLHRNLGDDVKEEVGMIHDEALRSLRIVQDLLVFARPSGVAAREPISLNTVAENVLNLKKYDLTTQNIQVEAILDPQLPLTVANLHAIQQVVLNLVVNAEQAMVEARGRGHLRVRTEQAESMARIVVSDDGPGISRENLPKVFDPFFTTKDVGKGTGLGLSICYGIVQEHGGAIRVESDPGHGATFIVELPIADAEAPDERREIREATAQPIAKLPISRTRSVSEKEPDERSIRYLLSKQLEELGYRCVAVSNGQEALAHLAQQGVELVLLDMRMPGMSGLDVLRRIRTDYPRTHVVMLTALADAGMATQALRLGADDYMTKPYSMEELKSRLVRALDKQEPLPGNRASDSSLRAEERGPINEREVTKDLIIQQVSAFQQLTEPTGKGKQRPKRHWWNRGHR